VSAGDYFVGLAFFAATVGLAVLAGARGQVAISAGLRSTPRMLAIAALAAWALVLAHLLPAVLGLLSRESALIAAAALALAAHLAARRAGAPPAAEAGLETPRSDAASIAIAALAAGALGVFVFASLYLRAPLAPSNTDALAFHLPGIGRLIQTGTVWRVDQFIPGLPTAQYPQNGDLLLTSAILPWLNDAFVRLVNYAFLGIAATAVFATGRELGAARATAVIFAALIVSVPAVNVPVTDTLMADAPLLAGLATGALFLTRHARTGRSGELVIAGVALGIAFGTKWYGVTGIPVVIGVWVAAMLIGRLPWRLVARRLLTVSAIVLLAGGFWLVRNLIESGDPFYPARVGFAGVNLFDAPAFGIVEQTGRTIADYFWRPEIWKDYFLPAFEEGLSIAGLALVAGAAGAAVLAFRGRSPQRAVVLTSAAAALALAVVYLFLPGTAGGALDAPSLATPNTRYLVPALILAAPLGAWVAAQVPARWRIAIELVALIAIADGIRQSFEVMFTSAARNSFIAAFGLLGLALAAWRFGPGLLARVAPARRPALIAGVTAALTIVLVAGGYAIQRRYNDHRYEGLDPSFEAAAAAAPGTRIGLAGNWSLDGYPPAWPLFGPRIDNEVAYVGPLADGKLSEYRARAPFAEALRDGDYDLLVIGLGQVPKPHVAEERWARAAGYQEVARSERLALYAEPG
jgi:hypothetical protein